MSEPTDPFMALARQRYESKMLGRLGLSPEPEQRDLIVAYLSLVLRDNAAAELLPDMGDDAHLFQRHFCDSLQPLLLFGFKKGATVLDIGSGGGFPSIPIRLFRPDLSFMLVESCKKKAEFLEGVKAELGLDNVKVYSDRAESVKPEKKVDYVISRGIGTLQKFAQLARPFLTNDGHMYTYKTKQFAAELEAITSNKDKDGIKIREIAQYDLGSLVRGLSLVSLEFV
ncbi:MAG: 16S rRNA (guanine(527)-N(7))-methyltransferase RsmG [Chitinispirillia bacterium]|nr:16S rRNA (guanine(527)-N(7))-methyltransferase RsmG [Chitinispirillia bacterium]MCL2268501.1 16S rRNA (guanine(527)-N(7))-methyltransferase RsmG [Chitinispirillia bacterium]